jgi:hypothetical protein
MVVAAAEMCSAILSNFIVPKLKRKRSTIIGLIMIGILLLLLIVVDINQPDNDSRAYIELGILIILRLVLNGMWGFYFVYLTELYPS